MKVGPWSRASKNCRRADARLRKQFKNLRKISTFEHEIEKNRHIKNGTCWQILKMFTCFCGIRSQFLCAKFSVQKFACAKKLLLEGLPLSYNLRKLWFKGWIRGHYLNLFHVYAQIIYSFPILPVYSQVFSWFFQTYSRNQEVMPALLVSLANDCITLHCMTLHSM